MRPLNKNLFCKPICKPDAARQRGTGETEPTRRDVICPVRRGHHPRERRPGTPETSVVWLITQRSEVQILPPLPGKTALRNHPEGRFHGPCDQLCDQRARKSASSVPVAPARSIVQSGPPALLALNVRAPAGASPARRWASADPAGLAARAYQGWTRGRAGADDPGDGRRDAARYGCS